MASSGCSACHAAADRTLSRCSQCKWVAYCSKTCQRGHWKAGHRLMCAKLRVCRRFRDLERQWWATRPSEELRRLAECGLQPEAMSFFGEVFFLLQGLKACVLLSNLPPTWRESFASDVVKPSGVLECSVALHSVGTPLETPAEYELTGDLVLANTVHIEYQLAKRTLHLVAAENAATDTNVSALVQEQELARVLDYPVTLSECNEEAPMTEVGYFLLEGQQRVLLTSYCAMATPQHAQRVQQHFKRYQESSGGLELALQTSQI